MKESKNSIDDEVRKRLQDEKEKVKKESSGLYIKFLDQETKILEFIEPYEGEVVPVGCVNLTYDTSDQMS